MANGGTLKSLDECEFVLGLLAGGRDNYKNKLLVQDKQVIYFNSHPVAFSLLGAGPQGALRPSANGSEYIAPAEGRLATLFSISGSDGPAVVSSLVGDDDIHASRLEMDNGHPLLLHPGRCLAAPSRPLDSHQYFWRPGQVVR